MISINDYACSACLFFIMIIVHRGLYLALHCRGHFNSFFFMITSKVRMKPRHTDSLSLSSNQGRENDSVALVPIPNIVTYNINLITGNQPKMATIFRFFIDHKY